MAFEVFTRKIPRMISPVMSFSKLGQITFNQGAARLLQKETIEHILLLWDSEERAMAIKTTSNKKDPRAYRIRFHAKGNGANFSAKTFLDYAGIDYSQRRSLPIEINAEREHFIQVKLPDDVFKKKTGQPTIVGRGRAG